MGVHKKGGLVGGFDQLRAPNAPTISVSGGNAQVTVTITNPSDTGGGDITGYAVSALTGPIEDTTFAVTVVSDSGNKYAIDGTTQATPTLYEGHTYIFDQSDSSNSGHPLRFSTTDNGSHGSGSEYTTGVTTSGTPGSAGAFTKIAVESGSSSTTAGSYHFESNAATVTMSSAEFNIDSSEDFTYEFWYKLPDSPSNSMNFMDIGSGNTFIAHWFNTPRIRLYGGNFGGYFITGATNTGAASNIWYHMAITRESNYIKLYIDGTQTGSTVNDSDAVSGSQLRLNGYGGALGTYGGEYHLSDLRFVVGTSVYTGNFARPTGPLTKTGGTYSSTTNVNTSITASHTKVLTAQNSSGILVDNSDFGHSMSTTAGTITPSAGVPYLYYYCTNHSGMGSTTDIKTSLQGGASGSSSPITVSSLTNDEAYNVRASAINIFGQSPYSAATSASPASAIGIFMGGSDGASTYYNTIQTIDIGTTGNASDFGDLTAAKEVWDGVAGNATRSISFGGNADGATNVIEYVNPTSAGNGTDFGDMPVNDTNVAMAALANNTRAVYQRKESVTVEYVTIASTGNPSDFGDAVVSRRNGAAGFASTTRGCIAGGMDASSGTLRDQIDYITIASTGNSTDFGDLTVARYGPTGCSNATRGLILGGETGSGFSDVIDYVTIASTGNATDFGNLLAGAQSGTACASTTRAVKGGGSISGARQNVMQYVTIGSTGNATDFGDLAAITYRLGATSTVHGGIS